MSLFNSSICWEINLRNGQCIYVHFKFQIKSRIYSFLVLEQVITERFLGSLNE